MTEIVKFPEKGAGPNTAAEEQSRSYQFASTIARLAALSTQEYERRRTKEAKSLECRPAILDRLVARVRDEIASLRRVGNFKEEIAITPGAMLQVDDRPTFEAARMRLRGAGEYARHPRAGSYSICVIPDGEASIIIGWAPEERDE